jgi:hypothetical protein
MADDSEGWLAVLLGVLGLVALAKILDQKKCSNCQKNNPKHLLNCQYCGAKL